MARIEPVRREELSPAVSIAFERHFKEYAVRMTNMKAVLGHSLLSFEIYMQWYPLYMELERILGKRMACLFAYSISAAADCTLCATFFRKAIIDRGERPDRLSLSRQERQLMDFGACIARCQGNIADHVYDPLAGQYSRQEMIVLVAFAGQMIATAVFNNVLETDMDDFLQDYLPPVPSIW